MFRDPGIIIGLIFVGFFMGYFSMRKVMTALSAG